MAQAQWIGGTVQLGDGVVTDRTVASAAAIAYTKVQQVHKHGTNFALAIGGTPAAREEIVFVPSNSGTVTGFKCLCNDTGSSASVTFDLKKNGSSVLSGLVTITNATTDKAVQSGSITGTTFVSGDVFSIALAVSSTTGMTGPYAWGEFAEVGV
jgi:hypothetical protein